MALVDVGVFSAEMRERRWDSQLTTVCMDLKQKRLEDRSRPLCALETAQMKATGMFHPELYGQIAIGQNNEAHWSAMQCM
jgi:hypothetical protein